MSDLEPRSDAEFRAIYGVTPACRDLSRKETTSLLNRELVRCKLERQNAYAYWAHEVEVHDWRIGKLVRADFVQFEPFGYHTAIDAGLIEKGMFTFYEVKSCIDDLKSGHGLNFFGDRNYIVMPVEVFPEYKRRANDDVNFDKRLIEVMASVAATNFTFLLYGKSRNGKGAFKETSEFSPRGSRTKPASELLLCMMRALIANSGHSDVQHRIAREVGCHDSV